MRQQLFGVRSTCEDQRSFRRTALLQSCRQTSATILSGSPNAPRAANTVAASHRRTGTTSAYPRGRRRRDQVHRACNVPDSDTGRQSADRSEPFLACGSTEPVRATASPPDFDNLPPISTVLLSHNHYDRCDLRTLRMVAKRFDPIVVKPLGNARLLRSAGLRRVEELDWWQSATSSALPITLAPAHHFSARTPFDRNRALWGGFTLVAAHIRIFFAGDTAYAEFFHDIRRGSPPFRWRCAAWTRAMCSRLRHHRSVGRV